MKKLLVFCLIAVCFWLACTKDTFLSAEVDCSDTIAYNLQMQEIVDTYCSYSGCHDGISSDAPGDYTTYEGMRIHFGGEIFDRVLNRETDTIFGMPPNYADGPKDLTEEDFMLFNCWIEQEFPEN